MEGVNFMKRLLIAIAVPVVIGIFVGLIAVFLMTLRHFFGNYIGDISYCIFVGILIGIITYILFPIQD